MERLCERPGCSDLASVAYGMHAPDLVFWLDVLPPGDSRDVGVLCRRHADSMVVPRGWTLDDLRDPELHLFRPPRAEPNPSVRPASRTPRAGRPVAAEQLELGELLDIAAPPTPVSGEPVLTTPGPWTPDFDEADDLDGLLTAHSPLLARAFRTADRPAT